MAAVGIQLHRHQPWRELHNMRCQPQAPQRVGGFQPQQAAADYDAGLGASRTGTDTVKIVQGAVDKTVGVVLPVNGRHEGVGARGQHQFVVKIAAVWGGHPALSPINGGDGFVQMQVDPLLLIPVGGAQGEIAVGGATEIVGQMDPVVSQQRLLAKNQSAIVSGCRRGTELFEKVVTDHTIADDDQGFSTHGAVLLQQFHLNAGVRASAAAQAACSQ